MGGSRPRRSGRAAYAVGGRVPGADCQAVRADPPRTSAVLLRCALSTLGEKGGGIGRGVGEERPSQQGEGRGKVGGRDKK